MRFLLLICDDPTAEAYDPAGDNIEEWVGSLQDAGAYVIGDRLRPAADARTVRVRSGERHVDAGPFTRSEATVAGFDVIEAEDRDAAVEIASRHPMARFGCVEVRALWPFEG
ncbi:hypothetical protein GCM10009792_11030 [Microcella alkalica]|uniref:YCII-related domain-containing protein n=1 Tax=Microcella alkalica TaxID=355930 RepID=A0A839E4B4_9MICO|nr:YciI family protein [Microcella alkalica]MBA8847211.1 hypothetical protein [Microcella alkalica]